MGNIKRNINDMIEIYIEVNINILKWKLGEDKYTKKYTKKYTTSDGNNIFEEGEKNF